MEKGKLIVIEGACDGIGKTTQYELLKKYLINKGYKVISHHFPSYNTKEGSMVESYLRGEFGLPNELSPYLIHNFYACDRALTWKKILKKEYDNGTIILLDRYTTSTEIYQSSLIEESKKEEFIRFVEDYEYNKLNIKKPDIVIFLDANYEVVKKLRESRIDNEGIKNDIHEKDEEYMKKVYDNSKYVSNLLKWNIIKCSDDNKMYTIDEIHKKIVKTLKMNK